MNKFGQHSVLRFSGLLKYSAHNVRQAQGTAAQVASRTGSERLLCHMCRQLHAPFHTTAAYEKNNSKKKRPPKKVNRPPKSLLANAPVIPIKKNMTVQELAERININIDNVFEMMLFLDEQHNTDRYDRPKSVIDDFEIIKALVKKFGFRHTLEAKEKVQKVDKDAYKQPPCADSELVKRPPVVTIMGHVDHGKTTLLDALRKSNIVAKEFGGITQHIGAFSVTLKDGNKITFLDTPGHAAFSAMRARGAKATDIIVLVVAMDDGVMNQTVESIQHAKEADVPIIIAMNKMDKPDADTDRTKNGLLQHGIQLEGYGGDIQAVPISALHGTNLLQLQEAVLVEAEMLELKADYKGLVEGVVIESKTDPGRGKLSTALIQRGTLKRGAFLVAGTAHAKVKGMFNDQGQRVEKAEPGTAVEIMGWRDLPSAGDEILQVKTESRMKEVINYRSEQAKLKKAELDQAVIEQKMAVHNAAYQEHLRVKQEMGGRFSYKFSRINRTEELSQEKTKLSIIIKGDVDGSVEAILDTLSTYESDLCELDIVHFGVGMVTETDVEMASSFDGIVYAFNVQCPGNVQDQANANNVPIKKHNIIYRLMEDLVEELTNALPPGKVEETLGEADVLQTFMIDEGKRQMPVAGCRCRSGMLSRKKLFKLIRYGQTVYEGRIVSMRHVKSEVDSIRLGVECGLMFDDPDLSIQQGDEVICYDMKEVTQTIDWQPQF